MTAPLDLTTQRLTNGLFVQASAGTGKTYSIAALIVREIALAGETDPVTRIVRPELQISEILVTTFTRNAAAELRDRVRRRLVQTASALRGSADPADEIVALLASGTPAEVEARIDRIARAVAEFDSATISTIHAICSKVVTLAGESAEMSDEDVEARIIDEAVNDVMLAHRNSFVVDPVKVKTVLKKRVSEPDTKVWYGSEIPDDDPDLVAFRTVLDASEKLVKERLRNTPSFSHLVNRACDILHRNPRQTVLDEFRRRYRYIVVDESQDTDAQQWNIFRSIFPMAGPAHDGVLLSVGDPKQSIYKFRGADVDAYTIERDKGPVVSLATNHRSDRPVVEGLNALFAGAKFGRGIKYETVAHSPNNGDSRVSLGSAVEIIRCEKIGDAGELARAAARKVLEILHSGATITVDKPDDTTETRPVQPDDIVVLVRSNSTGQAIEKNLKRHRVPVVSTGTASVMQSESAEHWRVLAAALDRISDPGRVRHLLCSPLFGVPLTSTAMLDDAYIEEMQDRLFGWLSILRREGVAALAATIMSDPSTVIAMSNGDLGERRLTDFSHVADLLHAETDGAGCSPSELLDAHGNLMGLDPTSELVSRRVESDTDAVQVMTIHVSKGLEFPIVVVADMWENADRRAHENVPVVRVPDGGGGDRRVLDIGWAIGRTSASTVATLQTDLVDDMARLLYVGMTRAKHHVSLLYPDPQYGSILPLVIPAAVLENDDPSVTVRQLGSLPTPKDWTPPTKVRQTSVTVAAIERSVRQTYVRTSFSGILALHQGRTNGSSLEHVSGTEEGPRLSGRRGRYAGISVPDVAADSSLTMPMARIPGGTHIGTILHAIYEQVDPASSNLRDHVAAIASRHVTGKLADDHFGRIVDGVTASLRTPLGGRLGDTTLAGIGTAGRAAELNFEMSMASMLDGLKVNQIGTILRRSLPDDDVLLPYARTLSDDSFDIGLGGLINGSIDALLETTSVDGSTILVVSDYKSNRLDREGDELLIDAYSRERMLQEMEHHHYPLQAIVYGTAVYRMLRARRSTDFAEQAVDGFAYLFVRGMVGPDTPVDSDGSRHGVFTWSAPAGFWARMSDFFAGVKP